MAEKPPEISQALWDAYLAVRRDKPKGLPFTKLAWEALQRRAKKFGLSTTQFLQGAVDNNWLSFDPSWVSGAPAPMSRLGRPSRPVEHMRNMPVGTPSCGCEGCVSYREKRKVNP